MFKEKLGELEPRESGPYDESWMGDDATSTSSPDNRLRDGPADRYGDHGRGQYL